MSRKQKKSALKKTVPTRVGVIIILFLIFVLGLYLMNKTIEVYAEIDGMNYAKFAFKRSGKDICRNRGFQGSAQIHGWYEKQGSAQILRIADQDLASLPLFDNSQEYKSKNSSLKIIDLTPDLEKKLKSATKESPALITITGFVHTCKGAPIACLEYDKSKIKPYIM